VDTQVASLIIVDDFLPRDLAEAMRADIDEHFSTPFKHLPNTHQVWNYWFVPQVYTFLRTQPEKVIQPARVDSFMGALRTWSTETLGLAGSVGPTSAYTLMGADRSCTTTRRTAASPLYFR
jgi:hypothetical protein